jgi:hypothetical protein
LAIDAVAVAFGDGVADGILVASDAAGTGGGA